MKYNKLLIISGILFYCLFINTCGKDDEFYKYNINSTGNLPDNCECKSDVYNCDDFLTQNDAQAVFDYCNSLGYGDIHRLDANNDQIPCESLPYE